MTGIPFPFLSSIFQASRLGRGRLTNEDFSTFFYNESLPSLFDQKAFYIPSLPNYNFLSLFDQR